jgi:3-oxoacyl-(acyl-carrier-protein) synthase
LFVSLSKELEEAENPVKEAARIAAVILAVIAYIFSHASSRAINWNKEQEKIQNVSDRGF